jgi:acetaldehyde dehydrogenase (acetylating)
MSEARRLDSDLASIQEARTKVEAAYAAWQQYRAFDQDRIDIIVEAMGAAARAQAPALAEAAAHETGYGNARDKVAKNLLAADLLIRSLRGLRCVGVLREDHDRRVTEIGVPMGVVAAILPTTNPTSTAIYKTVIALKAGNGIVLSPHPRARAATCQTAAVLREAATAAGAPDGLIQCLQRVSMESTHELMRHRRTGVILSTGGSGIVKAAYSSGKPAFGVGPGNVPVLIDPSADVAAAVAGVLQGKTFDYGTLCSSEQTIVAEKSLREPVLRALERQGAVLCTHEQGAAIARLLLTPSFTVTAEFVGQPAPRIAERAGFSVPPETRVLACEIAGIGKDHPLSAEKLSPVLSLYFVDSFDQALDACEAILRFGGLGHTCGIYAQDEARVKAYALRMPAFRVLANTPTPLGSTGLTTNLAPAMTLGCGAVAGNITGDNITPLHLVNIKRLAYAVRSPEEAFTMPDSTPEVTPERVARAIDRYLSKRQSEPLAIDTLVDRVLQTRRAAKPAAPACAVPPPPAEPPPAPPASPAPPAAPATTDFVCEDDVRRALLKGEKIFLSRKAIITPSARDLAAGQEVLIPPAP